MNAFITVFYDWSRIVTAPLAWAGPLLVRLVVGWVFLWTGWQKLQILPRMVENFRSWGIPAPEIMTPFVSGLEFVGGLLLQQSPGGAVAQVGTLEPGKYADFITLERDPFAAPEGDLWKIKVTWNVAGEDYGMEQDLLVPAKNS